MTNNQSDAETILPRTQITSAHAKEYDLPGPKSRDDDEDSSLNVRVLDRASHVLCSNFGMTTLGHTMHWRTMGFQR